MKKLLSMTKYNLDISNILSDSYLWNKEHEVVIYTRKSEGTEIQSKKVSVFTK